MKDSSGYLGRETPKDLETEKDSRQKDTASEKVVVLLVKQE
jgi:hypothetical protein